MLAVRVIKARLCPAFDVEQYAEGLPGQRYYGGNEVVDQVSSLWDFLQKQALSRTLSFTLIRLHLLPDC